MEYHKFLKIKFNGFLGSSSNRLHNSSYPISLYFLAISVASLSAFVFIIPVFADVIGCDSDGIVCLNDNLELYSNEFRTLDLDFDGKYEQYYFDVNGRLKTNSYINE